MRIALAALGFKNQDVVYNKDVIINALKKYSTKADMVVFGESFYKASIRLCLIAKKIKK